MLTACGTADTLTPTPAQPTATEPTPAPTLTPTAPPPTTVPATATPVPPAETATLTAQPTLTPLPPTLTPQLTPTQTLQPTFDPTANTAQPGDLLVFMPISESEIWAQALNRAEVYALNTQTGEENLLTTIAPPPNFVDWIAPSHDGRYIAFSEPPGITLLDATRGEKTAIVTGIPNYPDGAVDSLTWSPDGSTLYYTVGNYGPPESYNTTLWQWRFDDPQSLDSDFAYTYRPVKNLDIIPGLKLQYVLPDGNLMAQYQRGSFQTISHAVYDLETRTITPLMHENETILLYDYQPETGRVLFKVAESQAIYSGQLALTDYTLSSVEQIAPEPPVDTFYHVAFIPGTNTIDLITVDNQPGVIIVQQGIPSNLQTRFTLEGQFYGVGPWLSSSEVIVMDHNETPSGIWLYSGGEGRLLGRGYLGGYPIVLGEYSYANR
jgi:hypothetical protein